VYAWYLSATSARSECATNAAAEEHSRAYNEADIVRQPIVVNLVNAHSWHEERQDQRDQHDEAVPETLRETGDRAVGGRCADHVVRCGGTACEQEHQADANHSSDNSSFVHDHVLILDSAANDMGYFFFPVSEKTNGGDVCIVEQSSVQVNLCKKKSLRGTSIYMLR